MDAQNWSNTTHSTIMVTDKLNRVMTMKVYKVVHKRFFYPHVKFQYNSKCIGDVGARKAWEDKTSDQFWTPLYVPYLLSCVIHMADIYVAFELQTPIDHI